MSNAELRDRIGSFSFQKCRRGSQGFSRVLLQLFGFLGHGKSSFINTCKYVWEDMGFSNIAQASDDDEGHTMVRITYPLTRTITLVDNRGFCKMGSYETGEIFAQLGNLLPLDTPVEWNEGFGLANRIVEAENLVKVSDFIVPIFLYSAKKGICAEDEDELLELIVTARDLTANLMPLNMKVDWCQGFKLADRIVEAEPLVQPSDFISPIFVYSVGHSPNPEEKQELKEILKTCREMTGVEAIIVLTHKSTGKLEKAEAMFRDLGATHVFSLENYTPKNQSTSTEVDNSVLKFLYEVVQDSIFRVGHSRDPQKEMTERKIFVLNYIHNKELEAHIQKLEGQKAAENAQMERAIKVKKEEAERQKQKDQKEHEEKIRQLEEEFQRQRLRDQYEYEQRLKDIQQRGKRK
ncbi:uncharacterized protein LOC144000385 isoform X1 [Lithobates pipiens]